MVVANQTVTPATIYHKPKIKQVNSGDRNCLPGNKLKYVIGVIILLLIKAIILKENNHSSGEEKKSSIDEPPDNNNESKYDTIEDGTEAFMQWMNSADKKSLKSGNPIILVKFVNDRHTVLYDTTTSKKVEVKLTGGVPYCKACKSDDCAHVGFTICLEQLRGHRHDGKEETVDDIISS